jgi:hypothetical protein
VASRHPLRTFSVVVCVLLVLVAGLIVADRVVHARVEREVRAAITENLDVTGEPSVDIGGFPFLTQLLAGSVDDATATAEGATFEGIAATDVEVEAHGISTSTPHTVEDATLRATLPTSSLQQLVRERSSLDVDVEVEGSLLALQGDVLGVPLTARLQPRVEDGALLVDVQDLALGGVNLSIDSLPGGIGGRLRDLQIPVEGLPDGVVLTSAEVVPEGVRFVAEGTDVTIPTDTGTGSGSGGTGAPTG